MRHFNSGSVFGRVIECKEEKSSKDKPYLSLKVQVSGEKSGSATAFCRIWGEERCREFLDLQKKNPGPLVLRGMMTSYRDDKNCFYSNFTCFSWEPKVAEPRAVFILRGEVDVVSGTTDGGQRMLLKVTRDAAEGYQESAELFELFCQGEKMLDVVKIGDNLEVKGMVRQEEVDDFYGGGAGPVRSYVEQLKVMLPF